MEKLKRPVYVKPGADDFFKKMRLEVNETVLKNSSLYVLNVVKSLGLLAVFFFVLRLYFNFRKPDTFFICRD